MIFFLKFVNLELMKAVDDVLKLYSMGGTGETVVQEWGAVEKEFIRNLEVLRYADAHPGISPCSKAGIIHDFYRRACRQTGKNLTFQRIFRRERMCH